MKFGKLLQESSEGMPEWSNLFLRYKQLKKHLKQIPRSSTPVQAGSADISGRQSVSPSKDARAVALQQEFLQMLNEDLDQFNQFYIDKEEESVIKFQALKDQIVHARADNHLQALKADLVELHGEMVLMIHWSLLNYAAVMKILKKHDKCTGWVLKAPFQPIVLKQPFSSTSVMSQLVKQAEEVIKRLVAPPVQHQQEQPSVSSVESEHEQVGAAQTTHGPRGGERPSEGVAPDCNADCVSGTVPQADVAPTTQEVPQVLRRTQMALHMWHHMSRTASTPSTVLPPEVVAEMLPQQSLLRKRLASEAVAPPAATGAQGIGKKIKVLTSQEVS